MKVADSPRVGGRYPNPPSRNECPEKPVFTPWCNPNKVKGVSLSQTNVKRFLGLISSSNFMESWSLSTRISALGPSQLFATPGRVGNASCAITACEIELNLIG